jgi:hypothetical protein
MLRVAGRTGLVVDLCNWSRRLWWNASAPLPRRKVGSRVFLVASSSSNAHAAYMASAASSSPARPAAAFQALLAVSW